MVSLDDELNRVRQLSETLQRENAALAEANAALQRQVSGLEGSVQDLEWRCGVLQEFCEEAGVPHVEKLAARLHQRDFARTVALHPLGATPGASYALSVQSVAQLVAERSKSAVALALVSVEILRCFRQISAQFPYTSSLVHCTATLQGHQDSVRALAVLDGGRLASCSSDFTIKVWDVATGKIGRAHV